MTHHCTKDHLRTIHTNAQPLPRGHVDEAQKVESGPTALRERFPLQLLLLRQRKSFQKGEKCGQYKSIKK